MWFTEDPWPPMLICGILGLAFMAWWTTSKRAIHLAGAFGCVLLGGVLYAVEAAIVTPAEQVEQLVVQLCTDFQQGDPKTVDYFSPTAPELKLVCGTALVMYDVGDDLRLTDFQTTVTNAGSRAVCHFRANATVTQKGQGLSSRLPARFELTWAKEGVEWKVIKVRRLHPLNGEEMGLLDHSAT